MQHILIVDDEKNYRLVLARLLQDAGYQVSTAENGFAAMELLARESVALILSDLKLPRMDGLVLFRAVREQVGDIPFILMTAFATVETALDAIKQGVYDYLQKPFNNDEVLLTIEQALAQHRIEVENLALKRQLERSFAREIIGESPAIRVLEKAIAQVAGAPSPVLISGESGVGKELVARILHRSSSRAARPWVAINCAALTETLLESELFGHERGAFTGAVERKKGLAEIADGGTLFLDEVGELPSTVQPKLLRLLQEKRFRRVGGTVELASDVRIVAASNRDLPNLVAAGRFREDLYYRLNVVNLRVPALRERPEDIPLLAHHFLRLLAIELGRDLTAISDEAMQALVHYPWPGNVRELRNAIERGILFSTAHQLQLEALPEVVVAAKADAGGREPAPDALSGRLDRPLPEFLDALEERLIRAAMTAAKGIQAQAAQQLGVSRSNLQYKLRKYNID